MPYSHTNSKGQKYFLHSQVMKNGKALFFFSKKPEGAVEMPSGRIVMENPKTGLPMLKKK